MYKRKILTALSLFLVAATLIFSTVANAKDRKLEAYSLNDMEIYSIGC